MQDKRPFYHAFRINYNSIVRELITEIHVGLPSSLPDGGPKSFIKFIGIWDTGATNTVITLDVVKKLDLKPTGKIRVAGINKVEERDTYIVDIGLPNMVVFSEINVTECNINSPDIDVLIGMDLIQLGDFAISNANQETLFSYCQPPHERPIDLLEKSNKVNQRLKKKRK